MLREPVNVKEISVVKSKPLVLCCSMPIWKEANAIQLPPCETT